MSDGCEWCSISPKGQDQQLSNVLKQAKDYAKQENIPVAIYKEGNEYKFISASFAIANGYPILQVLSAYQ